MSKVILCPDCSKPMRCVSCYMREIGKRGGASMSPARLKHMKRMTKERVKAQREAKQQ